MKTKWITITAILAVAFVALPVFAQEDQSVERARRQDRPVRAEQDNDLERAFTPQERALIRRFLRNRQQQQQEAAQRRDEGQPPAMRRGQISEPPARGIEQQERPAERARQQDRPVLAERSDQAGRAFTPQERALIRQFVRNRLQQREPSAPRRAETEPPVVGRGGGPGPMQRPFVGSYARQCPCCGRLMPQTAPRREGQRPFGPQRFEGRRRLAAPQGRPFARQGLSAAIPPAGRGRDVAERPNVPFRFEGRQPGLTDGYGFGPRRFEGDDETLQRPAPGFWQEDEPMQRPGRGRLPAELQDQRRDEDRRIEQPARPRLGRNAP